MSRFLKLTQLIILLFSINSNAQLADFAGYEDLEACPFSEPLDQYEVPTKISNGSLLYAGQCMDAARFRPPVLIEDSKSNLKFANYLHNHEKQGAKYYIAEIQKAAKIDAVFFHIVRFATGVKGVTAAHTQFRVRFADPKAVKLTAQVGGDVVYTNDVVISYEASRPKDVAYNFAAGVVDNYLLVGRVLSGRQRLDESYANETEQYLLQFPEESDSWTLLSSALNDANDIVYKQFYDTLRPNCTTKVFDLFDAVPSLKQQGFDPFLTELGPNPIAAPSIAAMRERNILKACYSNLRTELDDQAAKEIACPEEKTPDFPLLAQVDGFPYSVVIASESEFGNEEALLKAKSVAYQIAPQVVANLYASLMLVSSEEEFSILKTLARLAPTLKSALEKVNSELTDSPASLSLYLMPWSGEGSSVDVMKALNVPAKLPSQTYETDYNVLSQNERDGMYAVIDSNKNSELPVHLLSVALHMTLIKDASTAQIQILGQLKPQTKPLAVENDQVEITELVVPKPSQSFVEPTLVLLNLDQELGGDLPQLKAEFGPYAYADVFGASSHLGQLALVKGDCELRTQSTPKLSGKASALKALTGFGLFNWVNIDFQVAGVEFDLEKLNVRSLDLKLRTAVTSCAESESVNAQFSAEVNKMLEGLKDDAAERGESAAMSIINKLLSNNDEKEVPGFSEGQP